MPSPKDSPAIRATTTEGADEDADDGAGGDPCFALLLCGPLVFGGSWGSGC